MSAAGERSYLKSEVRGSGLECQAATAQEWPRGATLHPRSGAATKWSYPASEVSGSGWEELLCVCSQAQWPEGDTLRLRSGAVAERSYPMSEIGVARRSHFAPEAGAVTLRSHPVPEAGAVAGRSHPRSGG